MTADEVQRPHSTPPPYLITTATIRRGGWVRVTADASTSVIELAVHGQWSQDLGNHVTTTLQLCLAGPVSTIIINLHDMADRYGDSRPFWIAAVRAAYLRAAPVPIALCLPATTVLDHRLRHHGGPRPPTFATMPDARRAAASRRPHRQRLQVRLPPESSAVATARGLATQACDSWQLPQLRLDACLVVSELTSNAVQHAGTDLVVTVSRDDARLHLAVRDGDTRYPRMTHPSPEDTAAVLSEQGRGLQVVHAAAQAWGALPARGGKVVWATL